MTKTQIQLPDPLYREVKRVAKERDWPLAEVLRRGAEYMIRCYPKRGARKGAWELPMGQDLGVIKVPFQHWREIAHGPGILESDTK